MMDQYNEQEERGDRELETRHALIQRTLEDAKQWERTIVIVLVSVLVLGFILGFATGGWILVQR